MLAQHSESNPLQIHASRPPKLHLRHTVATINNDVGASRVRSRIRRQVQIDALQLSSFALTSTAIV